MISRRNFIASAAAAPIALAAACSSPAEPRSEINGPARLRLQARKPSRGTVTGNDVIYGDALRRAYLRVPLDYNPAKPTPLIIEFHGGGGRGDTIEAAFASRTDALGAIVLAPDCLGQTWDLVQGTRFTSDVPFINDVLDQTFDRCNIDASRIAVLGFSDGASYALSLGLSNGDQVAGIVAFSPGFYQVDALHGKPPVFISHGTSDTVLPIDLSRGIVGDLRTKGYDVTFVEFGGRHEIPNQIADQAMTWLDARI
jgi:poly(3-hydroxybutyrate) depolymerase